MPTSTGNVNFFRSIQGQLLAWLLLVGIASYVSMRNSLYQSVQDRLLGILAIKQTQVQRMLTGAALEAQALGNAPFAAGDPAAPNDIGIVALKRLREDPGEQAAYRDLHRRMLQGMQLVDNGNPE